MALSQKLKIEKKLAVPETVKEPEKKAPVNEKVIKRLRSIAETLKKKGEEKFNQDREENTARRARMAASARADASKDIATAETMVKIADAIEAGEIDNMTMRGVFGTTGTVQVWLEEI